MTLSAFSGVLIFYVVSASAMDSFRASLPWVFNGIGFFAAIVVLVGVVLAAAALLLAKKVALGGNDMTDAEIKPIEHVAIPVYMGMFVIAIEIAGSLDVRHAAVVMTLLFLLWAMIEKVFYFNPFWLMFGYRFYEARGDDGNTITIISRRDGLKARKTFADLKKINEHTFLEGASDE